MKKNMNMLFFCSKNPPRQKVPEKTRSVKMNPPSNCGKSISSPFSLREKGEENLNQASCVCFYFFVTRHPCRTRRLRTFQWRGRGPSLLGVGPGVCGEGRGGGAGEGDCAW